MIKSGQALQEKNKELKELAVKKAEAEQAYRIALAKKMLELKTEGMSVSLINDLARGDKIVAELKMQRDISESLYDACREKIKDLRVEIDIMRSMLTWEREEYKNSNIG
ncbi:hypothetical protein [Caloranaerobacter sp. DY30410]|uniref:hypothetical protein n=1 Tax=Caloranaerobacter sp. DY30410 TaxID=3238305 RepID=UPI003D07A9E7